MIKKFLSTQPPNDNEYILMFDDMSIKNHIQYNNREYRLEGYQDHGIQGRSPQLATNALSL